VERARALLPAEDKVVLNVRHREALATCLADLYRVEQAEDDLLVAENLRAAHEALGRITGQGGVESMLDALFGRFCVGK